MNSWPVLVDPTYVVSKCSDLLCCLPNGMVYRSTTLLDKHRNQSRRLVEAGLVHSRVPTETRKLQRIKRAYLSKYISLATLENNWAFP